MLSCRLKQSTAKGRGLGIFTVISLLFQETVSVEAISEITDRLNPHREELITETEN